MEALPSTIDFDNKEIIDTLKKTVALGATNEEFFMFVQLCKAAGLNPLKREAWFVKAGGRTQIMVGLNGYLTIANRNPQFDGMEVDVESDQQGNPLKAICKVYRKDRKYPSVGIALMKEFRKDTPIWKQMPSVMLTKVAKSIAIREAFSLELAGTYAEEEMPPEYAQPRIVYPIGNGAVVDTSTGEIVEKPVVKRVYKYKEPTDFTEEQYAALIEYLDKVGAGMDGEVILSPIEIKKLKQYEISS